MTKTAHRDDDGNPIFIQGDGDPSETFPPENITRPEEPTTDTRFIVYGFVGDSGNHEEVSWEYDTEEDAIYHATNIYGRDDVTAFARQGEVFNVEIHEVPEEYTD